MVFMDISTSIDFSYAYDEMHTEIVKILLKSVNLFDAIPKDTPIQEIGMACSPILALAYTLKMNDDFQNTIISSVDTLLLNHIKSADVLTKLVDSAILRENIDSVIEFLVVSKLDYKLKSSEFIYNELKSYTSESDFKEQYLLHVEANDKETVWGMLVEKLNNLGFKMV